MTTETNLTTAMEYPENVKAFYEGIGTVYEDRVTGRLMARGTDKHIKRVVEGVYDEHCRCFLECLYQHFVIGRNSLDDGEDGNTYLWLKKTAPPASAALNWGPGVFLPVAEPTAPVNVHGWLGGFSHQVGISHYFDFHVAFDPVYARPAVATYEHRHVIFARNRTAQAWQFGSRSADHYSAAVSISPESNSDWHLAVQVRAVNGIGHSKWSKPAFYSAPKAAGDPATIFETHANNTE